jgi:hypothetical protein
MIGASYCRATEENIAEKARRGPMPERQESTKRNKKLRSKCSAHQSDTRMKGLENVSSTKIYPE